MDKIKLNVKGKNIPRFIKRLASNEIELLNIKQINQNEVNIVIYKKDYDKVLDLKTIYEIDIVETYGLIKLKKNIKEYKHVIISLIIAFLVIIFLSNVIFNVNVISNNNDIRKLLLNELESYNIKKYSFKKSFNDVQIIKNQIQEKYKDKIEWLEIENIGTTYIVRLEERIIKNNNKTFDKQNVVAKKSAILKDIIAKNGQVVKELNSYVEQGEIVISGNIYLNDEVKQTLQADGVIYGEVWYNVSIEYPYVYSEIKSGIYKNVYVLKFLNKEIEFNSNKIEKKNINEMVLLKNNLLPISLVRQKQTEIKDNSVILTPEEAIKRAELLSVSKINEKLDSDERIINYKVLSTEIKEDCIILNVFFSIYENITDYSKIEGDNFVTS